VDSPDGVCPGQARFEYPATSVLFSNLAAVLNRADLSHDNPVAHKAWNISIKYDQSGPNDARILKEWVTVLHNNPGRDLSGNVEGRSDLHATLALYELVLARLEAQPGRDDPDIVRTRERLAAIVANLKKLDS
jgi:hypothetical protein